MLTRRPGTPELRMMLKRYYREYARAQAQAERIMAEHRGMKQTITKVGKVRVEIRRPVFPERPTYPEECHGMTCGAKNRKGMPCKLTAVYQNGRCKFHGGLSTGPRTRKGKRRSALNGLRPKRNLRGAAICRPAQP